tara:strand:+ start:1463 stop:1759 length:297 start_codon:yes stop_codon:yes gene_type:complete
MRNTIITPSDVCLNTATVFNKNTSQLMSETRKASVVAARDICFKICKDHLFMVQDEIGKYFNKNRSSIAHGLRRADRNLSKHPQYRKRYDTIIERLEL